MEGYRGLVLFLLLFVASRDNSVDAEVVQTFNVLEGAKPGTIVGTIGSETGMPPPPYLIVPGAGSPDPDTDFIINPKTGEIRTKSELDREKTRAYKLSAIPLNGDSISVTIKVDDVNDNRPVFDPDQVTIDIPENIPTGTRRKLLPAIDQDLGGFGTREYAIKSGNVGDAFEVSYDTKNPKLDLIVKGNLDREKTDAYTLVIVAKDGGNPPKTGSLTLKVNIQDLNDSPPVFSMQRYFTSVSSDLEIGSTIMKVEANDADKGDNSRITYSINRRQSDKERHFDIDSQTGLITLSKKLDFDRQNVHEIVIVARDGGEVPQETSAFITVRVSGNGDVTFPNSYEDASSERSDTFPVTVPVPYLGSNDHSPVFGQGSYTAEIMETAEPGTVVVQIQATDQDSGDNGKIVYSLRYDENGTTTYSDWFDIDKVSGAVVTQGYLDCELEGAPNLVVVATDMGLPQRSATTNLKISVTDVNDNKPIFESSFYEVQLSEDVNPGDCFLTLKAKDVDCGNNAVVRYTFQDDLNDAFKIGSKDGKMCLTERLDHETKDVHNVIVLATDKGGLSTSTLVRVNVKDVNDNFPEFSPTSYDVTIGSSHPLNEAVVIVKAFDHDSGSNADLTYQITAGNDDGTFSLDSRTGELYLARQLQQGQRAQLLIEASDGEGKKSVNQASVEVFVSEKPHLKNIFKFEAREDVSPYSEIGTVDVPKGYELVILEASYSGYFSIHPTSGMMRSEARLDHEANPKIVVNIKFSSDSEDLFGQVIVDITDVNDNAPEFAVPLVVLSVPEDFPSGENADILYSCTATDADSNLNGKVTYRIKNDDNSRFSIDQTTGNIRLLRSFDFETSSQHEIVVEAEDSGLPRLKNTMKLTILVHDVNDNAPIFDNSTYFARIVQSSTLSGTPVITVRATDRDHGRNGRITYQVARNPYFKMLPTRGTIVLKRPLDRDAKDMMEITVTAVDHGIPSLQTSARVEISIADRNDHVPTFDEKLYTLSVAENSPVGHVVGNVRAVDEDKGKNGDIEYRLRTPIKKFKIETGTGRISTAELLDREERGEYELLVEAVDNGQPRKSSQTVVKVVVDDVNDEAPVLEQPSMKKFFVRELSSSGTHIGKLVAVDKDLNDRLSFELLEGTSLVSVDRWSGDVFLKRSLRLEDSNFTFTVRITDSAIKPHSITEEVIAQIVNDDFNQITSDFSPLELSVDESSTSIGSFVGSLSALRGRNESQFYYLLDKNQDASNFPFYINAASGEVFSTRALNASQRSVYETQIGIETDENPFRVTVLTVKVHGDVAQNGPRFPTDPILVKVSEDSPVGGRVLVVSPENQSSLSKLKPLKYRIIEQMPASSPPTFNLAEATGELTLAKELDYERVSNYLITVGVSIDDPSETQYSALLTVAVVVDDVNDFRPTFLSAESLEIPSDFPIQRPFFEVFAADEDSGNFGTVSYSIKGGDSTEFFAVNSTSGEIFIKKSLLAGKSRYSLTLRAEDGGKLFSDQVLTINIRQESSLAPKFADKILNVDVAENLDPNTLVATLPVINTQNEDLEFSIYVGDDETDEKKFKLDPNSGELRTLASLDREDRDGYVLVVGVTSKRSKNWRDAAEVRIRVVDVNDNDPVFGHTCRPVEIPENEEESSLIHVVAAYDSDSGMNSKLKYSVTGGEGAFNIDEETGQLRASSLDRETAPEYNLVITATDHGEPPRSAVCSIFVKVLDKNDNEPVFTQSAYAVSVSEDVAKGTEVLRVSSTDVDEGPNADIVYAIRDAPDLTFSISKTTGSIFTSGPLDRETVDQYSFNVVATDSGSNVVRTSTAKVTITITDANDNIPEFDEFPFRVNSSSTPTIGLPLVRLTASDPDLGANGQLTFSLVRPEHKDLFSLTPDEGVLSVISPDLTWDPATLTTVEVAVSDAGTPPRSSTGLVEIKIEGGPSTRLDFEQEVYISEVNENPLSGADLMQVRAVRSDGRRQRVIYTFMRGNDLGAFEINSNNGLIRVRDPELIDFEKYNQFVLIIAGQGLGEDNLIAYAKCIIKVRNLNDNAPKFLQQDYSASIKEGLPKNSVVLRVEAFDLDEPDENDARGLIYEIIDGNIDGAFSMKTSQPGIVLTNTVLDREIRDKYELTITAKDQGNPSQSGTTKVLIHVLDVNDSPLQFPAIPPIKVSKNSKPGSLLATVRTNDIDTFPAIAYRISNESVSEIAIDTFTGQVFLLKKPSAWSSNPLKIILSATDQVYKAEQLLTVYYEESGKDCKIRFESLLYTMELDMQSSSSQSIVGQVKAKSCGSESDVQYFIDGDDFGVFSIAPNGSLIVSSVGLKNVNISVVGVVAKDRRSKKISRAVVSVKVRTEPLKKIEFQNFPDDGVKVDPNSREVLRIKASEDENQKLFFSMTPKDGFRIDVSNGIVYNVGRLGGDTGQEMTTLNYEVTVRRADESLTEGVTKKLKLIVPTPLNSNAPGFSSLNVTLSSTVSLAETIDLCPTNDEHQPLQIVSGNEEHLFTLDSLNRRLLLSRRPSSQKSHYVVIKMGKKSHYILCRVNIFVVNDDKQKSSSGLYFPISEVVTSLKENAPIGSFVFRPPIVTPPNEKAFFWTESDTFSVDSNTGDIFSQKRFDFESETEHQLQIFAKSRDSQSVCNVRILVESMDEFPPLFDQSQYIFNLPSDAAPGDVLGQVRATDRDKGVDGQIVYNLAGHNPYFTISSSKGVILVSRSPDTGLLHETGRRLKRSIQEIRLIVEAKSRRQGSLSSTTQIFVSVDELALPARAIPTDGSSSVEGWVQGVIVGIVLIILAVGVATLYYCKVKRARDEKEKKLRLAGSSTSGLADQSLEMSVNSGGGSSHVLSRFPPQYSDIVADFDRNVQATTSIIKIPTSSGGCLARSEFSEKSSGRGSVEDDEDADVEIRMINEGGFMTTTTTSGVQAVSSEGPGNNICSFLSEEDKVSEEGSVQNTEEYLARLGIDIRKPPNFKGADNSVTAALSDHYSTGSIYNRILDETMSERSLSKLGGPSSVAGSLYGGVGRRTHQPSLTGSMSSVVHSEDELAGSYNWDYLLDWGPSYRPLAHVFKEISQLRDDPLPLASQVSTPTGLSSVSSSSKILPFTATLKNPTASRLLARPATRSPISHDVLTQSALSPNFHPALSPLATKSPSVSPLSQMQHKRDSNKISHI